MGLVSTGSSPVSSIIYYNSFSYTINHVNLTLGKKCPQTTIINTKNSHKIIYLLYKLGCINNFVIHSTLKKNKVRQFITFSIFFYKNTPFFKSLRLVSSPARRHTITYKGLSILKQSIGTSVIILSTTKGIITHEEALNFKIGGLILAILN